MTSNKEIAESILKTIQDCERVYFDGDTIYIATPDGTRYLLSRIETETVEAIMEKDMVVYPLKMHDMYEEDVKRRAECYGREGYTN